MNQFFPEIKDEALQEYASKSNFEMYTGIVLDKEDNAFKTISGKFRDKKDFYEKVTGRGYVVRKVLETPVFNWIEKNAKTNIEAYAMFSTALSKWRGNNILSDYYVKILNDIPQLNRERIKGNPNTKGKAKKGWGESILDEQQYYQQASQADLSSTKAHDLTIYPLVSQSTETGEITYARDPKYRLGIKMPKIHLFKDADIKKQFDDPMFYRQMFRLIKEDEIDNPAFQIIIDNEFEAPITLTKGQLLGNYKTKNKNPYYKWGPKELSDLGALSILRQKLEKNLQSAEDEEKIAIETQLKDIKNQIDLLQKSTVGKYNPEEEQLLKNLKQEIWNLETLPKEQMTWSDKKARQEELYAEIDKIEKASSLRNQISPSKIANRAQSKLDLRDKQDRLDILSRGFSPGNPKFDGNSENNFLSKLELKRTLEDKIKKAMEKKDTGEVVKLNKEYNKPYRKGDKHKNSIRNDIINSYNNKSESVFGKLVEAAVNNNATTMYIDQRSNAQDQITAGMLPFGGIILEDNIGEAKTNSTLNPKLFENEKLKTEIIDALLEIAAKFEDTLGLSIKPVDIYFTGSSANYNYNDKSDIDLHLVYDFENAGINADILSKFFQAAKKDFNNTYNIKIKGIPVEIGVENLATPLVSTAVYSLANDEWLRKPSNTSIEIEEPSAPYYEKLVNEIEKSIQSQDSTIIGNLWKLLGTIRKDSLAKEGEFGPGNILFKKLRNLGYLDRLKDAYYNSVSQELSLEALEEII